MFRRATRIIKYSQKINQGGRRREQGKLKNAVVGLCRSKAALLAARMTPPPERPTGPVQPPPKPHPARRRRRHRLPRAHRALAVQSSPHGSWEKEAEGLSLPDSKHTPSYGDNADVRARTELGPETSPRRMGVPRGAQAVRREKDSSPTSGSGRTGDATPMP